MRVRSTHCHGGLIMLSTTRLLTRCIIGLIAFVAVGGCATGSSVAPPALVSEDVMVPAADTGVSLFMRNKTSAGMKSFSAEKTVLFVHGATYPSEITFDLKLGDQSWMDYIASRGYDVWLVDVRGYGRSSKTAALSQPASANPPFANTEDAVRDVATAVDFILKRRGIAKLNLMGWSWGTTIMALYTTRNNERVNKLVLYAPVWTPPTVGKPPATPTVAYRAVTVDAARQRWYNGVPAEKQAALIPAGWFDSWARAMLESDLDGAKLNPPVLRAPNGTMVDILGGWLLGKRLYDAEQIRVPTMLIKAEWDADTPAQMAQGLFASLKNAPYKSYVEVGEGTHTLMLEKNRMQLFRSAQAFLDEPAP
jgi:pimeloyl-ACP methyl ester carboxylesterase